MTHIFSRISHKIPSQIRVHFLRWFSDGSNAEYPLQGVRILDMTRVIAGPTCTLTLADFGAEVIKVEHPERGDDSRRWPAMITEQISCSFAAVNRNKKSIGLNFQSAEGQNLLKSLAQKCDVFIENYIPGVLNKYGLDYESMKSCNPQLIYCSLNGFGSKGPYSRKAGVDLIASSMGGLLYLTGPEDGEPCRTGPSLVDLMTGLRAHGAIIAALYQRQNTKRGCRIEVDLYSTAITSLQSYAVASLNLGIESKRRGTGHEFVVPYKTYKTKDGYVTTGAISDLQFKSFCEILSVSDLAADDRFSSSVKRAKNRKKLDFILSSVFLKKTTKEWCNLMEGTSLPYGPLNNVAQVFEDEHTKSSGIVKEVKHKKAGVFKLLGSPVDYDGKEVPVTPPPLLGEHTDEVLKNLLQYSEKEISSLKKKGIIK